MKNTPPYPVAVLRSHTSAVHAVQYLSNERIASASADGEVKIWDLATRRTIHTVHAHSRAGILSLQLFQSGKLVSQGRDGFIKVWDSNSLGTEDAKPLFTWFSGSYSFCKAATNRWNIQDSEFLIASPTADASDSVVVDIRSGKTAYSMNNCGDGMCLSIRLYTPPSEVSPYIALGYESGFLKVFDCRAAKFFLQVQLTESPVLAFDITRSGDVAFAVSPEHDIFKVCLNMQECTAIVQTIFSAKHPGYADVCLRDDNKIFATAGWDHRIRIFSQRKPKLLAILKHHDESVYAVNFKGNSGDLASGSKDSRVALWHVFGPT